MTHFLRFASAVLVVALGVAPPTAARSAPTGHLFVAIGNGKPGTPYEVGRFPLYNGIPASKPDRLYPGRYTVLAAGNDGTLYAVGKRGIYVLPPGLAQPARVIDFPSLVRQCTYPAQIDAIAVDSAGYVFVAYTTYFSGVRQRDGSRYDAAPDAKFPCLGVVVFAPGANGHAKPVQAIPLGGTYLQGVTVDGSDNLFVANDAFDRVMEFVTPVTDPDLSAYQHVSMSYPNALATDDAGNLFVLDGSLLKKNGVLVYPPGAGSGTPPSSAIVFQSKYSYVNSIAVRGQLLYASDFGYRSTIDVYPSLANGNVAPIASIPEPYVGGIAAGP
jgi:hypothetical protein